MAEEKNEIVVESKTDLASSVWSSISNFEMAQRMANVLSKSTIVPKDYQNNTANCIVALEMSQRLNTSPLMVMQNLYVINGRPSWSAQYLIAMINGSGKYDMELQYRETQENGKPFSCQCWTMKNGREVTGPVIDMDMAQAEGWSTKTGSKWKNLPSLMLRYRAASFFARLNCPEMTLGYYTVEESNELGEYREVTMEDLENRVAEDLANANSVEFKPDDVPPFMKEDN